MAGRSRERHVPPAICGGSTQSGRGVCKRPAGHGTDHYGAGRCSQHGGNTPSGIKSVAVAIAEGSIIKGPVMGTPIQMDPTDALLWCVSITAGEVAYFTERIQSELTHDDVVSRIVTKSRERGTTGAVNMHGEEGYRDLTKVDTGDPALHVLVVSRQDAIDRLARFSKMALDAGVAERQVALAERQGDMIAHVLGLFIDKMRFGPKALERAERVLPEVLMALESPATVLEMAS